MPYPTTCSTLTPAVPALPCNSALYSATDLKVPHCRESGQEHQLLTFRAKAIVMTAAHTAMPPKPTKWSVLRPARSTRNSWKCSRKKKSVTVSKNRRGSLQCGLHCFNLSTSPECQQWSQCSLSGCSLQYIYPVLATAFFIIVLPLPPQALLTLHYLSKNRSFSPSPSHLMGSLLLYANN